MWRVPAPVRQFVTLAVARADKRQELREFLHALKVRARYDATFRELTSDSERSEILAALSNFSVVDDAAVRLDELKRRFGRPMARYDDHVNRRNQLSEIGRLIRGAPAQLRVSPASNQTIETFNRTLAEVEKFYKSAEQGNATLAEVLDAKRRLENGLHTLRFRTINIYLKQGQPIDEETKRELREMGISVAEATPTPTHANSVSIKKGGDDEDDSDDDTDDEY
jgi:hypothetical protein